MARVVAGSFTLCSSRLLLIGIGTMDKGWITPATSGTAIQQGVTFHVAGVSF